MNKIVFVLLFFVLAIEAQQYSTKKQAKSPCKRPPFQYQTPSYVVGAANKKYALLHAQDGATTSHRQEPQSSANMKPDGKTVKTNGQQPKNGELLKNDELLKNLQKELIRIRRSAEEQAENFNKRTAVTQSSATKTTTPEWPDFGAEFIKYENLEMSSEAPIDYYADDDADVEDAAFEKYMNTSADISEFETDESDLAQEKKVVEKIEKEVAEKRDIIISKIANSKAVMTFFDMFVNTIIQLLKALLLV